MTWNIPYFAMHIAVSCRSIHRIKWRRYGSYIQDQILTQLFSSSVIKLDFFWNCTVLNIEEETGLNAFEIIIFYLNIHVMKHGMCDYANAFYMLSWCHIRKVQTS